MKGFQKEEDRIQFFMVSFIRNKTGSRIVFVAATDAVNPKKTLREIFQKRFPGWMTTIHRINENTFVSECEEARFAQEVDWNVRQPDTLFQRIAEVAGNFFDPKYF
jgi:hypothetical protein